MKTSKYLIWESGSGDILVKMTKYLGKGSDGREYISVEGSTTGIPLDECRKDRSLFLETSMLDYINASKR